MLRIWVLGTDLRGGRSSVLNETSVPKPWKDRFRDEPASINRRSLVEALQKLCKREDPISVIVRLRGPGRMKLLKLRYKDYAKLK